MQKNKFPEAIKFGGTMFFKKNRIKNKLIESWDKSQEYELDFWENHWPYRDLSREKIVHQVRLVDAKWFLKSFKFKEENEKIPLKGLLEMFWRLAVVQLVFLKALTG